MGLPSLQAPMRAVAAARGARRRRHHSAAVPTIIVRKSAAGSTSADVAALETSAPTDTLCVRSVRGAALETYVHVELRCVHHARCTEVSPQLASFTRCKLRIS